MASSISKREAEVIQEVKNRDMIIFTPKEIRRFLKTSKENTNRILNNMIKKDLCKRIEKGKYILTEHWKSLDTYEIATNIIKPSYLGFWNALHHHNLTEQVPRKIFIATTKRKKEMKIQEQKINFIHIRKKDFFGYERNGKIIVSDPEKTILDSLRLPQYTGGIKQIYKAINTELNTKKMVNYAERINSSSIASRIGYLTDKKNLTTNKQKETLQNLITTYSKLDPKKHKTNPDPEWKIYANWRH